MNEDQKEAVTVWVANEAGHPYHKIKEKLSKEVIIKALSLGDSNHLQVDRLALHNGR